MARKLCHALAFGLFLAALIVMFKTFPSITHGPVTKGTPQPAAAAAAAAPNALIENEPGVQSVKVALEGASAPGSQAGAKQTADTPAAAAANQAADAAAAAGAGAGAAEKARRDADRSMCHTELLQDVDIFGLDVGSQHAGTAEECCVLCQDMPRCGAFTFVGSTCWFKGRVDLQRDQQHNLGCVSGLVRTAPEPAKYTQPSKTARRRRAGPPPPPLPPPPPYAIYLWLAPITAAVLCCLGSHVRSGTPLLVHEGGAKCSADDCCACD